MEQWKATELARQGGKFGSHGWWPWGLAAFDYDNDGDMDLLAQQHGQPRTMIIRNLLKEKGKLGFVNANPELGLPSNALAGCFKPLIWDFDGDGFLDLAYRDSQPETVDDNGFPCLCTQSARYFFEGATCNFGREPWRPRWLAQPPAAIVPAIAEGKKARFFHMELLEGIDLTGKGRKDSAWGGFGSYGGPMMGRYLVAEGEGGLTDATEQLGLPMAGTPVYFGDLNGDGADDVLVAQGDRGGLYLSDGQGKFALKPGPLTDFLRWKDPYLHKVVAADFNNDGRLDLVLSSGRLGGVEAYQDLGRGELRRVPGRPLSPPLPRPRRARFAASPVPRHSVWQGVVEPMGLDHSPPLWQNRLLGRTKEARPRSDKSGALTLLRLPGH
ncbi:MAG: VCBS repeat-containing protein [Planctomycetes bacterium]|nr:VCBS repeat-containing protein [Planctomycetota bacterium]